LFSFFALTPASDFPLEGTVLFFCVLREHDLSLALKDSPFFFSILRHLFFYLPSPPFRPLLFSSLLLLILKATVRRSPPPLIHRDFCSRAPPCVKGPFFDIVRLVTDPSLRPRHFFPLRDFLPFSPCWFPPPPFFPGVQLPCNRMRKTFVCFQTRSFLFLPHRRPTYTALTPRKNFFSLPQISFLPYPSPSGTLEEGSEDALLQREGSALFFPRRRPPFSLKPNPPPSPPRQTLPFVFPSLSQLFYSFKSNPL